MNILYVQNSYPKQKTKFCNSHFFKQIKRVKKKYLKNNFRKERFKRKIKLFMPRSAS